jgi:hypothetical protein
LQRTAARISGGLGSSQRLIAIYLQIHADLGNAFNKKVIERNSGIFSKTLNLSPSLPNISNTLLALFATRNSSLNCEEQRKKYFTKILVALITKVNR